MRTKQKNRKKSGINFTTIDSGLPKKSVDFKGDTIKTLNPNPIKKQRRINVDSVADDIKLHYANSLDEANYGGLSNNDIKIINSF